MAQALQEQLLLSMLTSSASSQMGGLNDPSMLLALAQLQGAAAAASVRPSSSSRQSTPKVTNTPSSTSQSKTKQPSKLAGIVEKLASNQS